MKAEIILFVSKAEKFSTFGIVQMDVLEIIGQGNRNTFMKRLRKEV